jgi:hypothetical protein
LISITEPVVEAVAPVNAHAQSRKDPVGPVCFQHKMCQMPLGLVRSNVSYLWIGALVPCHILAEENLDQAFHL